MHITGENERVFAGKAALQVGDAALFGQLMYASHESSRVNFENSTAYLDTLVDIARTVDGVIGSRLTGGGFGGSTVSLIRTERSAEIVATTQEQYFKATGAKCSPILTRPSQGARLLQQD